MALTSSILKSTEKSIDKLFSDPALAKEVTYKQFQGHSFDSELGMNIDVFINHTITAIFTQKEKLSVPAPGLMPIVAIEAAFLFRCADLPENPDKRDYIMHGDSSYGIDGIKNVLDIFYRIIVKGSDT